MRFGRTQGGGRHDIQRYQGAARPRHTNDISWNRHRNISCMLHIAACTQKRNVTQNPGNITSDNRFEPRARDKGWCQTVFTPGHVLSSAIWRVSWASGAGTLWPGPVAGPHCPGQNGARVSAEAWDTESRDIHPEQWWQCREGSWRRWSNVRDGWLWANREVTPWQFCNEYKAMPKTSPMPFKHQGGLRSFRCHWTNKKIWIWTDTEPFQKYDL